MIAVDTNILVYAHRVDSPWHAAAAARVRALAHRREAWAIAWPCLHEFLAIVTHPKIFAPPTPLELALDQLSAWLESPSLVLLGETGDHFATLAGLIRAGKVAGPRIHDARIAAICLDHGVTQLWSADRDFLRFPQLVVRNPLVAPA